MSYPPQMTPHCLATDSQSLRDPSLRQARRMLTLDSLNLVHSQLVRHELSPPGDCTPTIHLAERSRLSCPTGILSSGHHWSPLAARCCFSLSSNPRVGQRY